jgi:hypothetical protein
MIRIERPASSKRKAYRIERQRVRDRILGRLIVAVLQRERRTAGDRLPASVRGRGKRLADPFCAVRYFRDRIPSHNKPAIGQDQNIGNRRQSLGDRAGEEV